MKKSYEFYPRDIANCRMYATYINEVKRLMGDDPRFDACFVSILYEALHGDMPPEKLAQEIKEHG